MKLKKMSMALTMAFLCCCHTQAIFTKADSYQTELHTPEEIRQFYEEHPWTNEKTVYDVEPSLTAPYDPGVISEESQQNALNCLNFCRYAAGLPADVMLNDEYCQKSQAGQLVNAVNKKMDHYPVQPSDMSDELYQLGAEGTKRSNIWTGCKDLPQSLAVYLCDMGDSNMYRLGHRRWLLNPDMQYTGFGHVDGYTGTYATDRSRSDSFAGDYIAWPPQYMPYELYNGFEHSNHFYTFSVVLGKSYDTPEMSEVQVDMISQKTGESFHFDANTSKAENDLYFNIDTDNYGYPNCIIFDPGKRLFDADDVISVTVSGITKNGKETPISYDVRFFMLHEPEPVLGDVNADGEFTIADVILLQKWLLTVPDTQLDNWEAADLCEDGRLDVFDLCLMKKALINN